MTSPDLDAAAMGRKPPIDPEDPEVDPEGGGLAKRRRGEEVS